MKSIKCLICDKDATWIRITQFSGKHTFCDIHAEQELDFKKKNSYLFWTKLEKNYDKNRTKS
jgi:hypothetical protein